MPPKNPGKSAVSNTAVAVDEFEEVESAAVKTPPPIITKPALTLKPIILPDQIDRRVSMLASFVEKWFERGGLELIQNIIVASFKADSDARSEWVDTPVIGKTFDSLLSDSVSAVKNRHGMLTDENTIPCFLDMLSQEHKQQANSESLSASFFKMVQLPERYSLRDSLASLTLKTTLKQFFISVRQSIPLQEADRLFDDEKIQLILLLKEDWDTKAINPYDHRDLFVKSIQAAIDRSKVSHANFMGCQ